jgi:hypothetical protein
MLKVIFGGEDCGFLALMNFKFQFNVYLKETNNKVHSRQLPLEFANTK